MEKNVVRSGPRLYCHSKALRPNSLDHPPIASHLHIGNSTLQRTRQIDVEKRSVQPLDDGHPGGGPLVAATTIGLARLQLLSQIAAARGAGGVVAVRNRIALVAVVDTAGSRFFVFGALAPQFLFVLVVLRGSRGAVLAADLRHAEDGLPALEAGHVASRGRVTEAGGREGSFGPAVVDARKVPIYSVRCGVAVKLVADVDEMLDRGDVDIVDGGKVEDDGFEGGFVGFDGNGFAAARARIVPGAILCCMSASVRESEKMTGRSLHRAWGRN